MTSESLSPMAFRGWLTRTIVVPLSLLGVLALIFLAQILYLLSAAQAVDHTDRVISRANALLKLLVDGETGQRGYLLTGDDVFLEPYHVEESHIDPAFDELLDLVSDNPAQVARLKTLREDQTAWRDYCRKVVDLRRVGGDFQATFATGEGKQRMDSMRKQVSTFIQAEEILRETRSRTVRRATWIIATASLVTTILLGGVLAGLTRQRLLRVSNIYQGALASAEARADSMRRTAHRLETLHEIDRAILASESIPELVVSAFRRMKPIIPAEDAVVLTFGSDGEPAQVFPSKNDSEGRPSSLAGIDPLAFSTEHRPLGANDLAAMERSPEQDRLFGLGYRSCLESSLVANGERFGVLILAAPRPSAFSEEHREVADEIARQLAIAFQHARMREQLRRHADELERKVEARTYELQESLRNVKQLQGLLPICAWCKKVRDDGNYWHQVEHYVAAHTGARFTHGVCPACLKAMVDTEGQEDAMQ